MGFSLQSLEDFLLRTAEPAQVSFSGREAAVRRDKSNPLVRSFLRSIRDLKGRPKFKLKTGTADMNVVAPYWEVPHGGLWSRRFQPGPYPSGARRD